jgi:hypothetical protein
MDINEICAPALLYVAFSVTQIIIDTFKRMYNTALVKIIVMIIFTFILNILCQRGLGIISWFIVFIPFITMTVITTILLITFGMHPASGMQTYSVNNKQSTHHKKKRHSKKDCNMS